METVPSLPPHPPWIMSKWLRHCSSLEALTVLPPHPVKTRKPKLFKQHGKRKLKRSTSLQQRLRLRMLDEKDLDYKKYKTRLCQNWQHTGRCPYGEACVYVHGAKEMHSEQENEAALTSLTKLADQLVKQRGCFLKPANLLFPLQDQKPKAVKKKPANRSQADCGKGSRQFGCPLLHKDACMPKPYYASITMRGSVVAESSSSSFRLILRLAYLVFHCLSPLAKCLSILSLLPNCSAVLVKLGGVFAQGAHHADYYVVYPGNTPGNHRPPLQARPPSVWSKTHPHPPHPTTSEPPPPTTTTCTQEPAQWFRRTMCTRLFLSTCSHHPN